MNLKEGIHLKYIKNYIIISHLYTQNTKGDFLKNGTISRKFNNKITLHFFEKKFMF